MYHFKARDHAVKSNAFIQLYRFHPLLGYTLQYLPLKEPLILGTHLLPTPNLLSVADPRTSLLQPPNKKSPPFADINGPHFALYNPTPNP